MMTDEQFDELDRGGTLNALDVETEIVRMEREQFDLPNMMRNFGTDNDPED